MRYNALESSGLDLTFAEPSCCGCCGSLSSTPTMGSSPGCRPCCRKVWRGLTKSFGYVLIITIAQIPGYFSAAYLVEKVGRKWTLASYLFLTAVGAFFFRNAGAEMEISSGAASSLSSI